MLPGEDLGGVCGHNKLRAHLGQLLSEDYDYDQDGFRLYLSKRRNVLSLHKLSHFEVVKLYCKGITALLMLIIIVTTSAKL